MWGERIKTVLTDGLAELAGLGVLLGVGLLRAWIKRRIAREVEKKLEVTQQQQEIAMEEKKALAFEFNDKHLVITIDSNKDGESLVELKVNLAEVPDEILAALKKK